MVAEILRKPLESTAARKTADHLQNRLRGDRKTCPNEISRPTVQKHRASSDGDFYLIASLDSLALEQLCKQIELNCVTDGSS